MTANKKAESMHTIKNVFFMMSVLLSI